MTTAVTDDVQATIQAWDQAAWSLAAFALAARGDCPPGLAAAARELLAAEGLAGTSGPLPGLGASDPGQIAAQATAALQQAAALAGGRGYHWGDHGDEALLAHGRAGAQTAAQMARFMLPMMGGLADRVAAPGARMLDVGTGTGALAVAFAQLFPQLHVVGIDVLDRALDLARQAIAAAGVIDRVTVRTQDVAGFADDGGGFDVAWVPAPFIPEQALHAGLPRVVAALRVGGWLIAGHGKFRRNPAEDTLTRLKTIAYGGTPLDDAAAGHLLQQAGLAAVRTIPTPAGAPAVTIGQRPA